MEPQHQLVQYRTPKVRTLSHSGYFEEEPPPKRLLSGPYLYCAFAVGILCVIVGTYMTAHAFVAEGRENPSQLGTILKYVGPVLVIIGGLFFFGMAFLCVVAFHFNQDTRPRKAFVDDRYAIGGSIFYRSGRSAYDNALPTFDPHSSHVPIHSGHESGLRFIAETIEEDRRRKLSRKYSPSETVNKQVANAPPAAVHSDEHRHSHKGPGVDYPLEGPPKQHQQSTKGPLNEEDPDLDSSCIRSRSYSLVNRKGRIHYPTESLKRNFSLTPTQSYLHVKNIRQLRQKGSYRVKQTFNDYPPELQYQYADFSSLRKKQKGKKEQTDNADEPQIFQLPSYSPDIIHNLLRENSTKKPSSSLDGDFPSTGVEAPLSSKAPAEDADEGKTDDAKPFQPSNSVHGVQLDRGEAIEHNQAARTISVPYESQQPPPGTARGRRPIMGTATLLPQERDQSPALYSTSPYPTTLRDGSLRKKPTGGSAGKASHPIDQGEGALNVQRKKMKKKLRKKRSSGRSSKAVHSSRKSWSGSVSSSSVSSSLNNASPHLSSSSTSLHLSAPPPLLNSSAPPSPTEAEASAVDILQGLRAQQDASFDKRFDKRLSVISEGLSDSHKREA